MSTDNDSIYSKEVQERFWSKVYVTPNMNACMVWCGATKKCGHGSAWNGKTTSLAHRLAYEFEFGDIPENLIIRHRCNNACCVNFRHCILGTRADNMQDRFNPIDKDIVVIRKSDVPKDIIKKQRILQRFWDKVNIINDEDSCWNWENPLSEWGYGHFQVGRKNFIASRFSWILENGDIPEGLLVCHSCDNPACVRISHLFLGTALDNSDDMISKGRNATIYTDAECKLVFEMYSNGISRIEIAETIGMSLVYVSELLRGEKRKRLIPDGYIYKPMLKYTDEQVSRVFELRSQGLGARKIARIMDINEGWVGAIIKGKIRNK